MADWLTSNLGYNVNNVANSVRREFEAKLDEFNISFTEFVVLVNCYGSSDNTVSGISRMTPYDPGRVSRTVNDLVKRGLVRRRRIQSDRRVVRLTMTEEGQAIMPPILNRVLECNTALLIGVTDREKAAFVSVSRKIIANHTAMRSSGNNSGC